MYYKFTHHIFWTDFLEVFDCFLMCLEYIHNDLENRK